MRRIIETKQKKVRSFFKIKPVGISRLLSSFTSLNLLLPNTTSKNASMFYTLLRTHIHLFSLSVSLLIVLYKINYIQEQNHVRKTYLNT